MRQEHRAGEKLFVDFPGQTIPIVDPATGEIWRSELFVAVLGASNYSHSGSAREWLGGGAADANSRASSSTSSSPSGSGQPRPARRARSRWLATVVYGRPKAAPTWRRLRPSA